MARDFMSDELNELRQAVKNYLRIIYNCDPDDMTEEEAKAWEDSLKELDRLSRDAR